MRADFDRHNGTFLLYPTRMDVWRKRAKPICETVCSLAKEVSYFEQVKLGVLNIVDSPYFDTEQVQTIQMKYNDIWVRDSGAIPVREDLVAFQFNAWGGTEGLYADYADDQTVPMQMSQILNKKLIDCPLTLEGGNLAGDGKGTLVAIRKTICNPNRNPNFSQEEIEEILKKVLNVTKIIWIDEGLVYDETGGHIDNLLAFATVDTILLAWTDDEKNPQYSIVRKALKQLRGEKSTSGKKFKIVKVPLPDTFVRSEEDCEGLIYNVDSKNRLLGEVIQPSYINFIFVNGGIILPAFGDARDEEVYQLFCEVFPDRKIVRFPAREIVLGGGGLHCITKNY